MIEFSIPGFYMQYNVVRHVLDYYNNEREVFNDDVKITSCYDSFPCVWDGGRIVVGDIAESDIKAVIKQFNDYGVSLRYTFSNSLLTDEHLNDFMCNKLLDITAESQTIKTGITVNLPKLKEHIENKYKDSFYFIASTTMCNNDLNTLNEYSEHNLIVPDYSLNNNFDKLSQFKNKDNVEILVAEACVDNCKFRKDHYKAVSKSQINLCSNDSEEVWICPHKCEHYKYSTLTDRNHYISIDDIRSKYVPLGFTKFKISGRQDNIVNLVEKFVKYLIKPEYQDKIRNEWLLLAFRFI